MAGARPQTFPPWGLDAIDMPDSVEGVQATIAAFPEQIDGRTRSGGAVMGGSAGIMYGEQGIFWIVQIQPTDQIEMLGIPGVNTPTDWVKNVGSGWAGALFRGESTNREPPLGYPHR